MQVTEISGLIAYSPPVLLFYRSMVEKREGNNIAQYYCARVKSWGGFTDFFRGLRDRALLAFRKSTRR